MKQWLGMVCLFSFSLCWASGTQPPEAAVASAAELATDAGFDVMEEGGNAFDAAIAVSAALGVVEPFHSGFGGGGFWLLYQANNGQVDVIDGREVAPMAAHSTMFLDDKGEPTLNASLNGALAAAIPGEPAALVYLAENYGNLPLSKDLAPAIRYAKQGFEVDHFYQTMANKRLKVLQASPAAAKTFLLNDDVPPVGYVIKQPELAAVMERVAAEGKPGFYEGGVAENLVSGVQAAGGIWTKDDLKNYAIKKRKPVQTTYRDMLVTTVPPPSAGGVALVTMLNILSGFDLAHVDGIDRIHLVVESMRLAYWDRAIYLGDADYVNVPVDKLTSMAHADDLRKTVKKKATPSRDLVGSSLTFDTNHQTTHFSVLDKSGNRVAATLSLNYIFGSGFMPPGTGVILNDQMDDFSVKPGEKNAYGLVGHPSNAIVPNKRPLSSMTPTFLETKDRIAILGTPGGSRIPTMVLLATLDFVAGNGPHSWVSLPRYHHQYLPDRIQFEEGAISPEEQQGLVKQGYHLDPLDKVYGDMQAILWDKKSNTVTAASDPRKQGVAEAK